MSRRRIACRIVWGEQPRIPLVGADSSPALVTKVSALPLSPFPLLGAAGVSCVAGRRWQGTGLVGVRRADGGGECRLGWPGERTTTPAITCWLATNQRPRGMA